MLPSYDSTQVHRKEVALVLNEITISSARLGAVDMSDYYYIDSLQIISRAPAAYVPLNSVTRPFTWPVSGGRAVGRGFDYI